MQKGRFIIIVLGILLPYLARLPGGIDWLQQYTDISLWGWLFFGIFNAIAWGAILAISFKYKRPLSLIAPCLLGFGFLAWAHYTVDLAADAQAAIALIFIPIFALLPIAIGGIVGYWIDQKLERDNTKTV